MEFNKIDFISDFLSEFTEELDLLEDKIFNLRRNISDVKFMDSILIHIKKLRSLAFMMNFLRIENIISKLYKLFEGIKDERLNLSNEIIKLFIIISDKLRKSLQSIESGNSDEIEYYEFLDLNLQKAISGEKFVIEYNSYKSSNEESPIQSDKCQVINVDIARINEVLQNFDKLIMRVFGLKKLLYDIFDLTDGQVVQKNTRKIRQVKEAIELIENQSFFLQDGVISMRKISFNHILQPFKRMALLESLKLGKNVAFDIPFTDVKIDKSILERIPHILENLVSNSLEHGIESEEERIALGKKEYGIISVNVQQILNRIILTFSDDGRGIDFKKIKQRVLQIYPENENEIPDVDYKKLTEYLFKPNITTKEINGENIIYGMGLKEVKDEIDKIKGNIKIDSHQGKGTSIEISMPLSLATQEGIFVIAGRYKLFILAHYIKEILTVKKESLIPMQSETVIPVRNELIPIYNSNAIFDDVAASSNKNEISVIIFEYLGSKAAVIIDVVLNYTTVVIKTLPPVFRNVSAFQGIVFDEDYRIVPILNVPDLVRRIKMMNQYEIKKIDVRNTKKVHSVLIADSSDTTRQIEKDILEKEDFIVTICCDGIEALELLKEQHFDLIVTDMTMPRMDGYVFIHNIRHILEYENIPIIVLSSDVSYEEKEKILKIGAQAFISKTNFKREKLIETAKELLRGRE